MDVIKYIAIVDGSPTRSFDTAEECEGWLTRNYSGITVPILRIFAYASGDIQAFRASTLILPRL